MDEVKAPVPPDAWQRVWVSYDDEGFFSAPRTEAELRVYFEIAPGLVEQRQEGTTFENWVEECEHYGLLIPQRPDAAFGSRSDVEVVPIEFINDLIEGGVQYWALTPGVFAAEEPGGGFTVVDNSTGDCFTETFASLTGALAYIDGAEPEDAHRIDLAPLPLDLITFDCDAVFGTNVCSIDNDDWLNIYVDYDMARGEVADHLEISLNRADGKIEYLTYPLDAMQRRALLPKMDAYRRHETGKGLAEYANEAMGEPEIAEHGQLDLDAEAHDMRGVSDGLSHDMSRSDCGQDAR